MRFLRRTLFGLLLLALIGAAALLTVGPGLIERSRNTVAMVEAPSASRAAHELHTRLTVVDLHADTLLWARDLLARGSRGHVDVPRLIEGNVALQVFSSVTRVPSGSNYQRTDGSTDLIFWLGIAERWPLATWSSRTERALYHARRLHDAAADSNGRLTVIGSTADLDAYLERRRREPGITAGLLAIEGLHALDGDLNNVDRLYEAGYRMMGLAHFFDNAVAGSAHGVAKGGLTDFGVDVIERMEQLSILVDLAHASPQAIDDTLVRATRPVVVSHTGVAGTCPGERNLTDEQIRRIAAGGGLIGIALFDGAICGVAPADFARAVRYVTDLVGVEYVGLGSDFDGNVRTPFDVTGLPVLTQSLLEGGFSEREVALIMGGNAISLLRRTLPASG